MLLSPHMVRIKVGRQALSMIKKATVGLVQKGKVAISRKLQIERKNFNGKKVYSTQPKVCRDCPIQVVSKGESREKKFAITYYKAEYVRTLTRLNSKKGKYMKGKRQSRAS